MDAFLIFRWQELFDNFVAVSRIGVSELRASVLECGGPPPLLTAMFFTEKYFQITYSVFFVIAFPSARGLAHSGTLRAVRLPS